MTSTLVIAEAGVNHNGDINLAKELIDAAANAGADLVKFQTFKADSLATKKAPKAKYQISSTNSTESQYNMLKRLELSRSMHEDLIDYCNERGVKFFSTAFDIDSLDYLKSIGFRQFKVPSGEITNLPYLRHLGSFNFPIILSTGMSTIGEIDEAIEIILEAGTIRKDITILHCNTEYPTPMLDVNLKAMVSLGEAFGVSVGYSDHTMGIEVPIAAVALGAKVIEKHLTLDRRLPGPDHKASIEPNDFEKMVRSIRNIEKALGDGVKRPSRSELKNKLVARRSIVAKQTISKGDIFTPENLSVKRPGSGISPMNWDMVLGRRSSKIGRAHV